MVLHVILTTVITCNSDTQICYTDYYYTTMLHRYTDTRIFTGIHALIIYIYSCSMYFLPVILFPDCFPLLLLILSLLIVSLLDISVVDTRCVELSTTWISATGATSESHISCISFPVILYHDFNKAHVLLSYYLYHALF